MIIRSELKEKGRTAFKANYWKSVLVSLVLSTTIGTMASVSGRRAAESTGEAANVESVPEFVETVEQNPEIVALILGVLFTVFLIAFLVTRLFDIFLTNPLQMGCMSFFLRNSDDPDTELKEVKKGFTPNYMRNVKALFLKDLKVLLWGLLLLVPGIIKSYAYAQVPYILAEDPDIAPKDALRKSEEMMKGHKKEAFILDMSFCFWYILSLVTFGLAYILYVGPYTFATNAEFYKAIRDNA